MDMTEIEEEAADADNELMDAVSTLRDIQRYQKLEVGLDQWAGSGCLHWEAEFASHGRQTKGSLCSTLYQSASQHKRVK